MAANPVVLIADGDTQVRLALYRHFTNAGFSVHVSDDAEKTFTLLHSVRPDVVILDMALPSYPQMMWLLKQHRVILTATSSASELARVLVGQGAADFMVKPIDLVQAERLARSQLSRASRPRSSDRSLSFNVYAPPGPSEAAPSKPWFLWILGAGLLLFIGATIIARMSGVGPWGADIPKPAHPPLERIRNRFSRHKTKEAAETQRVRVPGFSIAPPPLPSADNLLYSSTTQR
jgi:CheY-like chemotaxis protein